MKTKNYEVRYGRGNAIHIEGLAEVTKTSSDGMNYARSACPTISRTTLAKNSSHATASEALDKARSLAKAWGKKVCSCCEKAALRTIAEENATVETPSAAPRTTYTASYTTPDGQTITETRQTERTYTHAAIYRFGSEYAIGSFHSSAVLAKRGSHPYVKPCAVVACYDIKAIPAEPTQEAVIEIAKSTKCQGRPAPGQGTRINKKCDSCNHEGSAKYWRAHTPK